MPYRIDTAVLQLALENPGTPYQAGPGHIVISTSTSSAPVRKAVLSEKGENSYTPQLHARIAAAYDSLGPNYSHQDRLDHVKQKYGRGERTVGIARNAFSTIPRST